MRYGGVKMIIDNSSFLKSWIEAYTKSLKEAEQRKDFQAVEEYKKIIKDLKKELKTDFKI